MKLTTTTDIQLTGVPEHYVLCYNDNCSKAQTCLRRIVAKGNYVKDNIVSAVNPALYGGDKCSYYAPNTPVRLAYGMLHTFDNILARDIAAMRNDLREHFGNGSYYRRRNGTQPITPEDQQFIARMFKKYGYDIEPVFDCYKTDFLF